ncbi:MAG: hypothetical protein EHM78_12535 [Myxococcaceae bacterium]|jgi:hypothetical protein|nr:MAG: hypothetical protein EHM78_12535 [Myxococcaceae bacterium]
MTTSNSISLESFEQIARTRGLGSLLIGALLLAFWVGGHGALYNAYRTTETHAPATVVAQAE